MSLFGRTTPDTAATALATVRSALSGNLPLDLGIETPSAARAPLADAPGAATAPAPAPEPERFEAAPVTAGPSGAAAPASAVPPHSAVPPAAGEGQPQVRTQPAGETSITYEYPLNERVRTLLRLEDMYERVLLFMHREASRDHEVALARLFEIMDSGARADIKSDLLQELERLRVMLESLRGNPAVAGQRLDDALAEVMAAASGLHATQGKFGQHLRDNEWLMAIRSRFNIPGGACEFDLPGYHHWLHQPVYVRQGQLQAWLEPLLPIQRALRAVLRFLRESGEDTAQLAPRGSFQQMPILRPAQMLRLRLPGHLACVPEISANKYALNIRFISNVTGVRASLHEQDVPFTLAYCNL